MCLDLGAAFDSEWPRRRLVPQIEPRQRNDRDVIHARWGRRRALLGQASIVPSLTTTALPPIEAPVSLPPLILIVSSITLGRPIS
jgi:hypothetical protein